MANRRITELSSIEGSVLTDPDLLTIVCVTEVDPTLKNKKLPLSEFNNYLSARYLTLSGGTLTGPLALSGATPASASAPGTTGEVTWDANYTYTCIAPNTWRRAPHSSW